MLLDYETLDGLKKTERIRVKCDRCNEILIKAVNSILTQHHRREGEDVCKRCSTIEYNQTRPLSHKIAAKEASIKKCAGKKLEEIIGKDKAELAKNKMSFASCGEKNSNFGGKYSKGFSDNPLSGSWKLRYGEEKSNEMKLACSIRNAGENNPMYGKPTPKKAGNGLSGRYKDVYFRSLLELSYMLKLDKEGIIFISCEASGKKFEYELNNVKRTYHPDIFLPATNEFVEVKPSSMLKNLEVLAKANAVIQAGEKFTFITQKDIIKLKKEELLKLIENGIVSIDQSKQWRLEC